MPSLINGTGATSQSGKIAGLKVLKDVPEAALCAFKVSNSGISVLDYFPSCMTLVISTNFTSLFPSIISFPILTYI